MGKHRSNPQYFKRKKLQSEIFNQFNIKKIKLTNIILGEKKRGKKKKCKKKIKLKKQKKKKQKGKKKRRKNAKKEKRKIHCHNKNKFPTSFSLLVNILQ
jgi:hypothetical protein